MEVIKRNGNKEEFDITKINKAVEKAFDSCGKVMPEYLKNMIKSIFSTFKEDTIYIEDIQNKVEDVLMNEKYFNVAKSYIIYREKHKYARFIKERIDYMNEYSQSSENAATSSETDANANVTMKNVANLEGEVYKTTNRIIQRQRMKDKLNELYPEVAKQYEEDLNHHIIYTHDEATSPVLKQYCMAVSLYPLMTEGVGNIDGITPTPPNDLQSFSGQITNLIFLLSSQCKGAVAVGEYFIALNYYIVQEFGPNWYEKLDVITTTEHCNKQRTIKDAIYKAFKQFIYGVNQPAGNRSYQSPFTNVSYYDHTYFSSLFGEFYYPDGTKPQWEAVDCLQRLFMKFFNKLRTKQILTFPVETMAMVYDPKTNDIIDKDYKDFTAEMYAEGHSFFTYISDSADSLASCCFTPETKVLWKSSNKGVKCSSLKELDDIKWENKKNLRIFHNGFWIEGKTIKTNNTNFYKVTTANKKVFYMTDNHINLTLKGEKKTKELSADDYLMFNTNVLEAVPEKDEHLTYAQGFAVGAFLGDGSFGNRFKDGIIYEVNYSQNEFKYKNCMKNIDLALQDLGSDNTCILNHIHNNVYPVRVSSKELVSFIQRWTNWTEGTYSYNKELNLDCLMQSKEFRKGILDGWYNTDGGNSNRCYTTSEKLKDCMEILITSLGMNTIIDKSDRTDEKVTIRGEQFNRNYPLWCIRWYEPCNKISMPGIYQWSNNSQFFKIVSIEHLGEFPEEQYSYCIECKDKNSPYFTLPSGLITHNCRLRNELAENTFSPTSGLTGVMTGSCNVITLNINRIVQDYCSWKWGGIRNIYNSFIEGTIKFSRGEAWEFQEYLKNILDRVYKYHIAFKTMLYDLEDKGMFAASNGGYIHISKLYSTIGINGLNEAARFLGMTVSNNKEYIEFLQLVLNTIKEQNKLHAIHDKKKPFLFNSEVVPAEGLGGKNYSWDKSENYWVPKDENLYNSYFFDAHDNTSVLDKMILHGRQTTQYCDGGSACHINLEDHLSKEQYLKLIDFAIDNGTNYFTFNIPNSKCDDCGYITKHPIAECPKCHSKNITQYTRVIGYLRPVKSFGKDRQIEANKRVYSKNI